MTDTVKLCSLCNNHLNAHALEFKLLQVFKSEWPSVFWKLPCDDSVPINFWQFVPIELRQCWLHRGALNNSVFQQRVVLVSIPIFVDLTTRIKLFNTFKQSWSLDEMVCCVNKEFFPCIKCPVGCDEFIDSYGGISFVHYISKIFPSFTSFAANGKEFLNEMRSDYEMTETLFDNDFHSPSKRPCIVINDNGVFPLTVKIMI